MNQGNCTHTVRERCIFGTWVVAEVIKAIEMSYNFLNVFQFWEYQVTCLDKGSNSGGFYAVYDMFLKLKQESSGCQSCVQSEADKDKYIQG